MSHRPFSELRAAIDTDPERSARVDAYRRAIRDALSLADRQAPCDPAPGQVLDLDRAEDYLAALTDYVATLGGHLELRAVFPDGTTMVVGHFSKPESAAETLQPARAEAPGEAVTIGE
jgi:hypothetical protein